MNAKNHADDTNDEEREVGHYVERVRYACTQISSP